ncbi:MAG: hypothetical protein KC933_36545 [Myxococcales bacterium]|nr:hypothetical protein [Myxococcales bacterium]MCB9646202.1 hypothetical protein [Deltaproteobacteria bacterium]
MPGVAHFIYIPLIIGIGFVLGWKLGASSVQNQWDRAEAKRKLQED